MSTRPMSGMTAGPRAGWSYTENSRRHNNITISRHVTRPYHGTSDGNSGNTDSQTQDPIGKAIAGRKAGRPVLAAAVPRCWVSRTGWWNPWHSTAYRFAVLPGGSTAQIRYRREFLFRTMVRSRATRSPAVTYSYYQSYRTCRYQRLDWPEDSPD